MHRHHHRFWLLWMHGFRIVRAGTLLVLGAVICAFSLVVIITMLRAI